jgi:hypothetical protein
MGIKSSRELWENLAGEKKAITLHFKVLFISLNPQASNYYQNANENIPGGYRHVNGIDPYSCGTQHYRSCGHWFLPGDDRIVVTGADSNCFQGLLKKIIDKSNGFQRNYFTTFTIINLLLILVVLWMTFVIVHDRVLGDCC